MLAPPLRLPLSIQKVTMNREQIADTARDIVGKLQEAAGKGHEQQRNAARRSANASHRECQKGYW
jgi:hypothetical protein